VDLLLLVPELFDGSFTVITEFGRSVIAKAGFTLCHVEYTKQSGGRHLAVVQTGTDLLIRTIYQYVPFLFLSKIFRKSFCEAAIK
jgi:diaminopimelate decarboxylase